MELLKAVGEVMHYPIEWIRITFHGLSDWLGISEWAILSVGIGIIGLILGIPSLKKWLKRK